MKSSFLYLNTFDNVKKINLHVSFIRIYESVFIKHDQCPNSSPKIITQPNAFKQIYITFKIELITKLVVNRKFGMGKACCFIALHCKLEADKNLKCCSCKRSVTRTIGHRRFAVLLRQSFF